MGHAEQPQVRRADWSRWKAQTGDLSFVRDIVGWLRDAGIVLPRARQCLDSP